MNNNSTYIKEERKCDYCGINKYKYYNLKNNNNFCSRMCYGKWLSKNTKGLNNFNFNNKWSKKQKTICSDRNKIWHKDHKKEFVDSNRKRVLTQKARRNMGNNLRENKFFLGKHHSKEAKKIIGEKSKAKFTLEFKEKFRRNMEEKGAWIPLKEKSDYEIYFNLASFGKEVNSLLSKKEYVLIKEKGYFNNITNTKGVVKDHRYTRRNGCLNKVFPELLRHPINCKVITHSDNVKKKHKENGNNIKLEELFKYIKNYKKDWHEQQLCLPLIEKYKNNERWQRL